MAGATAATAAGVTASQANTITVNLTNDYISTTGGNHLNADLTGDGHPDLTIANAFISRTFRTIQGTREYISSLRVNLNGVHARAYNNHDQGSGRMTLGSRTAHFFLESGTFSLTGSIPLFFKDLNINGGKPTAGSLEVTVSDFGTTTIQLDSFTYNTPVVGANRAVPDQGSTLALLAMGAGGVLALRHRRKTSNN